VQQGGAPKKTVWLNVVVVCVGRASWRIGLAPLDSSSQNSARRATHPANTTSNLVCNMSGVCEQTVGQFELHVDESPIPQHEEISGNSGNKHNTKDGGIKLSKNQQLHLIRQKHSRPFVKPEALIDHIFVWDMQAESEFELEGRDQIFNNLSKLNSASNTQSEQSSISESEEDDISSINSEEEKKHYEEYLKHVAQFEHNQSESDFEFSSQSDFTGSDHEDDETVSVDEDIPLVKPHPINKLINLQDRKFQKRMYFQLNPGVKEYGDDFDYFIEFQHSLEDEEYRPNQMSVGLLQGCHWAETVIASN